MDDSMEERVEALRSMSLGNIITSLEDKLSVVLKDERENDILVRLIPDDDLKFAHVGEIQGLLYHNALEICFTVYLKKGEPQDVTLDQVADLDQDTRTLLTMSAIQVAQGAMSSEQVNEAKSSVIKYQMLMELVQLLAS